MWETIIIVYLITAIIAWGMYIGRIRKMCPNGVFTLPGKYENFKRKGYDSAIVRAIFGPFSIWWSFKYENALNYKLKWK